MLGLALKFKVTAATILLIVTSVLYLASQSQVFATAGINQTINFQGKVVNSDGTNVTDGDYDFTFRLYKVSTSGTVQWTENWTGGNQISVSDGIFRAALGTHTSMSSLDFNDDSWYLTIEFNGDGEMDPRIRFASVPYAFNAKTVGGLSVTNTTGTLTIPNSTTISFAGAFSTVGANALTLTTTGTTGVTLPTTGTLATLAGNENLTNKTIGSTGLTFSGASLDITTATDEDLTPINKDLYIFIAIFFILYHKKRKLTIDYRFFPYLHFINIYTITAGVAIMKNALKIILHGMTQNDTVPSSGISRSPLS